MVVIYLLRDRGRPSPPAPDTLSDVTTARAWARSDALVEKWVFGIIWPCFVPGKGYLVMPHVCHFTGRKTRIGRQCTYRGKAKYLGGVGIKITGRSARKFKPNLQKVRVVIDGRPARVWASTKAIKSGLVQKRLSRRFVYRKAEASAAS